MVWVSTMLPECVFETVIFYNKSCFVSVMGWPQTSCDPDQGCMCMARPHCFLVRPYEYIVPKLCVVEMNAVILLCIRSVQDNHQQLLYEKQYLWSAVPVVLFGTYLRCDACHAFDADLAKRWNTENEWANFQRDVSESLEGSILMYIQANNLPSIVLL